MKADGLVNCEEGVNNEVEVEEGEDQLKATLVVEVYIFRQGLNL